MKQQKGLFNLGRYNVISRKALGLKKINRYRSKIVSLLTLPVAPQQASLASSITTFQFPCSSLRYLAALTPVIPLPIITTSAYSGSSSVVLWPNRNLEGSECQNDLLGFGTGNGAGLGLWALGEGDIVILEIVEVGRRVIMFVS